MAIIKELANSIVSRGYTMIYDESTLRNIKTYITQHIEIIKTKLLYIFESL